MKEKSSISWTALILGYARRGCLAEAMDLFRRLRQSSTCVDSIVLTSIISFFASSKNLEVGKQLHCYTIKAPSNLQISVANSILDMYIECRLIEEAVKFFSEMVVKNVVSYTTMIGGYGSHGRVKEAVQLFKKMQAEEIKPDPVTYWVVLSTCGQSGLVDARECFTALCNDGRVDPAFRRYALEFDGLGRGGVLREAKNIMEKMTGNMKSFASSLLAA